MLRQSPSCSEWQRASPEEPTRAPRSPPVGPELPEGGCVVTNTRGQPGLGISVLNPHPEEAARRRAPCWLPPPLPFPPRRVPLCN